MMEPIKKPRPINARAAFALKPCRCSSSAPSNASSTSAFRLSPQSSKAMAKGSRVNPKDLADAFKGEQIMAVLNAEPVTYFTELYQRAPLQLVHIAKITANRIVEHGE
jgi:hypothetical protein